MKVAAQTDDAEGAKWPRVPLNSVCQINPRRTPALPLRDDEPTAFVPMPAVDAQKGVITQQLERPFGEVKKGYTYFENGDVIFAKITPCMQNGKHAVCRDLRRGFGFGSTEFHVLRPRPDLLADYLHLFLRQSSLLEDAERFLTGAVGQQRLPDDYLRGIDIPLPPLPEQERITKRVTEQLAAVERSRGASQARLAAAEALPAAYLRQVFEGPEAGEWPVVAVQNFAEVNGGVQKSPARSAHSFHRPYLTVRNVQRGSLDLSNVERFEVTTAELGRLRLCRGDILIVEGNGSPDQIGRNAIFDIEGEEWVHQNHVIRVRLTEAADCHYVSRYLNSDAGRLQMLERARSTSGLYTLSVEKVNSLEVPLPPPALQKRIAADLSRRLADVERLTASLRGEFAAIQALPAAILRAAFNGDD
ncbi:MAG TPA: restriction endonuclease subunit S [Gemmataceae bacterium]|nr:restriction endonuclease subunit S [Gemmataceae bacterium]